MIWMTNNLLENSQVNAVCAGCEYNIHTVKLMNTVQKTTVQPVDSNSNQMCVLSEKNTLYCIVKNIGTLVKIYEFSAQSKVHEAMDV